MTSTPQTLPAQPAEATTASAEKFVHSVVSGTWNDASGQKMLGCVVDAKSAEWFREAGLTVTRNLVGKGLRLQFPNPQALQAGEAVTFCITAKDAEGKRTVVAEQGLSAARVDPRAIPYRGCKTSSNHIYGG